MVALSSIENARPGLGASLTLRRVAANGSSLHRRRGSFSPWRWFMAVRTAKAWISSSSAAGHAAEFCLSGMSWLRGIRRAGAVVTKRLVFLVASRPPVREPEPKACNENSRSSRDLAQRFAVRRSRGAGGPKRRPGSHPFGRGHDPYRRSSGAGHDHAHRARRHDQLSVSGPHPGRGAERGRSRARN